MGQFKLSNVMPSEVAQLIARYEQGLALQLFGARREFTHIWD
jgi:hypothetical protein